MNQKKLHFIFSKHRNKGFLLDFLVKALDINLKEEKYKKIYQRFIMQEDISAREYRDVLQNIIDDIVHALFPTHENNRDLTANYINELLKLYDVYVLTHQTMAASQKQLDFIMLTTCMIPVISIPLEENMFKVISFIIPREKLTTIQNLFELITINKLEYAFDIEDTLFKYLDSKKDKGYDSIRQDIGNWISGKNIPDNRHIEMIVEALEGKTNFLKNELYLYFQIAKIMQHFYTKSINYFGQALTKKLVFHYRYQSYFTPKFMSIKMDKDVFDQYLLKEFQGKHENIIFKYFDTYFYKNFSLKLYSIDRALRPDYYNEDYKPREILRDSYDKYYKHFFSLNEEVFLKTLEQHLPFEYFKGSIEFESLVYVQKMDFNTEYRKFMIQFDQLYILTDPFKTKDINDSVNFIKIKERLESVYNLHDNPYIYFLDARFHAQNRAYKEATESYLKALEFGKNCIGELVEFILIEGLRVSAKLIKEFKVNLKNSKSPFVKFFREASFQNIISDLPEDISEHFLNDMKKQFDIYFKNMFDGVKQASHEYISPNLFIKSDEKVRIDYNTPNKTIYKNVPNPVSQLAYCCNECNFEAVKRLVENGADVNILKQSDKASAAMLAVPQSIFNVSLQPSDKIDKVKDILAYLIPKMSKEALNTKLIKQQETLLSYCIEYGWVESVELLIKQGVDLSQKAKLDEVSALYQIIRCIYQAKSGKRIPSNSKFIPENPMQSEYERKKLIKANKFLQGVTDDEREEEFNHLNNVLESNPSYQKIKDYGSQISTKAYIDNKDNYMKIFELILDASDKVDIPQKYNFTPLILATEINDEYLVKKLLEKGANPDYYNDQHYRAYDYAMENNNMTLAELLE